MLRAPGHVQHGTADKGSGEDHEAAAEMSSTNMPLSRAVDRAQPFAESLLHTNNSLNATERCISAMPAPGTNTVQLRFTDKDRGADQMPKNVYSFSSGFKWAEMSKVKLRSQKLSHTKDPGNVPIENEKSKKQTGRESNGRTEIGSTETGKSVSSNFWVRSEWGAELKYQRKNK